MLRRIREKVIMSEDTRTEDTRTEGRGVDRPDGVRLERLERLGREGIACYPNTFKPESSIEAVAAPRRAEKRALMEEGESVWQEARVAFNQRLPEERWVVLAGRVMARRDFGGGIFVDIQDGSGRIQVLLGRKTLPEGVERGLPFRFFKKDLDVGDIIGIEGPLFWTRVGELTVEARGAHLVTKSLRPLPEKWHGLSNVETRYRQRYVDLMVNREVRDLFMTRSRIIGLIREYLEANAFLEVETPMLHPIAGGARARPFKTHHNALNMPLYLRIAPELYLKRLLVGGFERVFEINRSFRNEGLSRKHNPEFTMLEFYQAYATYEDLMGFTEQLLTRVTSAIHGGLKISYQGRTVDMTPPWRRLTLKQSLSEIGGLEAEVIADRAALAGVLEAKGEKVPAEASLGKVWAMAYDLLVEPALIDPTFITAFPVEVSPLARRSDRDPGVVDRFELVIAGREMANAFSELNDPIDQRERFLAQVAAKARGDEEASDYDADYIRALQYGMPPAAGEGIGIDRLVMLLTDSASIRDVILFPHMRPEST